MASKPEESIFVALIEEIRGVRSDMNRQTEAISAKMESNQQENRAEFKDLREDIAEVKSRLSAGSERMENHSREIKDIRERCVSHTTSALERKRERSDSPRVSWWVLLVAGGALAWLGERAMSRFFNAMADPPAATASKP